MREIWKPLYSARDYEVSNRGRVRLLGTLTFLKVHKGQDKSPHVYLSKEGSTRKVKSLVYEAFGKEPLTHAWAPITTINGNESDLRSANLVPLIRIDTSEPESMSFEETVGSIWAELCPNLQAELRRFPRRSHA